VRFYWHCRKRILEAILMGCAIFRANWRQSFKLDDCICFVLFLAVSVWLYWAG
jgi:hypothetical protein